MTRLLQLKQTDFKSCNKGHIKRQFPPCEVLKVQLKHLFRWLSSLSPALTSCWILLKRSVREKNKLLIHSDADEVFLGCFAARLLVPHFHHCPERGTYYAQYDVLV